MQIWEVAGCFGESTARCRLLSAFSLRNRLEPGQFQVVNSIVCTEFTEFSSFSMLIVVL